MSLEAQRQLLEELNVLEAAAAQRFRKNPALRAAARILLADEVLESKPKRPHLENIMHQHELAFFHSQYAMDGERCTNVFAGDALASEISAFKDPDLKFQHILATIRNIDDKYHGAAPGSAGSVADSYAMYLSAPKAEDPKKSAKVKRKYLLSSATVHIDAQLKLAFSESESYGKYVDLSLPYEMAKSLLGSPQSYVDYLRAFLEFGCRSKAPAYSSYLDTLLKYLRNFHANVFPLSPETAAGASLEKIAAGSSLEARPPSAEELGKPNANGEVFCCACDKLFAKESVYQGHLSGKRHKKNKDRKQAGAKNETSALQPSHLEAQIRALATSLKPIIDITITDHQRQARFSEREQQLERVALEGELSEYTALDSDSAGEASEDEDDFDAAFSKDLPLGSDGIPIPLWLYRLQGLHRSYLCEVCGNIAYKGRQQFNKHFGQPKHVHGLMCLGVLEQHTSLFANISTIAEVQELWAKLKLGELAQQENDDNAIEVEDDDGNVMSRKDYEELKRQGLI
ncbi:hypothetical protein METBIDRAFT_10767 [Metschnikowia bicuspidata var. bicuspidata NRRL YB-4993]|uniref:C2H2-type domain-containing protein n=1 Tax=Metschnikowia bicuspidata var. bicuspidata NRRL YB-4993 TaxID=869754 RepID=A0A1A0HD69_9ASCO|nr:hypothetical protein METBIDRAFT_10767 [Metschnikowia bicuspidata var. bicuspidata NRRL YB-4993]OBA21842.1 hypothetical protein METBIDRAFT_10767 [Metschnikowia bicuspidata var. bicuspidata NRRL YB-4993]